MQYEFDDFVIDTELRLIANNGEKLDIEPRVFELLVYLCQHPLVPVSRSELIANVWGQRIVGDAAINRAVSELRKILEAEPTQPKLITTISKVGYQFNLSPKIINKNRSSTASTADINECQDEILSSQLKSDHQSRLASTSLWLKFAVAGGGLFLMIFFLVTGMGNEQQSALQLVNERPLTSLKGASFKGQLSKDGTNLLFIRRDKLNINAQVWLKSDETPARAVTDDSSYYTYVIHGDNDQAFATRFNNLNDRECDIVRIDLITGKTEPIFQCAERAFTFLAYDSKKNTLYFNYRRDLQTPFSIFSYQILTKRLQQLSFPSPHGNMRGDYQLALSPEANYLAILEYQNNSHATLKVLNLHTSQIESVKHGFDYQTVISWFDEQNLLMADTKGLHQHNIETDAMRLIQTNMDIGYVSVAPQSNQVVFDKGETIINLYRHTLDEEQPPQAMTNSSAANYYPQYANRSLTSVYISTDSGRQKLMIRTEEGKVINSEFNGEIKHFSNVHWSPDDRFFVASINSQLHKYDMQSKRWHRLLPERHNIHYVHVSNSNNLLFSSDETGDWQLWQLSLDTQVLSQLTHHGGYSVQGNVSMGQLYFSKFNQPGLYALNLITGEETPVVPEHKITNWNQWEIRGQKLYYALDNTLKQLDLNTSQVVTKLTFTERSPTYFSVSYDHRYIQREVVEATDTNIWILDIQ